jgi:hypothetical protein
MKKLQFIFNMQSVAVILLSFAAAYLSLRFQFKIYIDFLILGLIVVFPLTLSIKVAFKRREKAIQSLCGFKAAVASQFYTMESAEISPGKKLEFAALLKQLTNNLNKHLTADNADEIIVKRNAEAIVMFLRANNEELKEKISSRLMNKMEDINEEMAFLFATKNHQSPYGVRAIVIFAIYVFVIFYPASLLNETGFEVALWYVFAMSAFKSLILISYYNTQVMLENAFSQKGTDGIKVDDFDFQGWIDPPVEMTYTEKVKKEKKDRHDWD